MDRAEDVDRGVLVRDFPHGGCAGFSFRANSRLDFCSGGFDLRGSGSDGFLLGMVIGAVMIVVFTAAGHVLRVPEVGQLVGATRRLVLRLRRRGAGATS